MRFYLQLGNGMMGHTRHLMDNWGGGTVILSPRDLEPNQLEQLSEDVRSRGGHVLLDPQFYLPDATYERLQHHDYWPDRYESGDFWDADGNSARLIAELHDVNRRLQTSAVILPALHAEELTDAWYRRQERVRTLAGDVWGGDADVLATVALGPEVLRDRDQVSALLRESDAWNVSGIYLVPEHPPNQYLVSSPVWLSNVLDLIAGWRLDGLEVVVGYSNQQMIMAVGAAATAIASGNWRNVRSFPPDKFYERDEIRRHSTWFYVPQALSEYQLEYLDIAQAQGVLEEMQPPAALGSAYARDLFAGPQPSTVRFSNSPDAFRHYLQCLREQVANSSEPTFDRTLAGIQDRMGAAVESTERWRTLGVFGGNREFGRDEYDASMSALNVFQRNRGPLLRRHWNNLRD